jgi:preprotein translocase subunit SecA
MRQVERYLILEIIDQRWQEHLYDMDYLQHGIGLRGLAQMDPLVAYKNEAYELFQDLMNSIWSDFARLIYHVEVTIHGPDGQPMAPQQPERRSGSSSTSSATGGGRVTYSGGNSEAGAMAMAAAAGGPGEAEYADDGPPSEPVQQRVVDETQQLGRNDPCWCGSGKKYKKCHGA